MRGTGCCVKSSALVRAHCSSEESGPDFFRDGVAAAAAAVPGARVGLVEGEDHGVDQEVLAPVLAGFFRA
ncbi:hypothetical protein GCM10017691_06770 [Pseudonocardia petroleophila]|uniref:Uncharacterized protein n=1 Tax=Pseudonocardia petroleophila TaxID=37331 RepID=A0A7G7MJY6_9PSEU|nr:hypothetical protein [Pseudonocardia petroleophila]QNG53097.1 hypothetical protein H6H00_03460 [Pseudonocardia petroleophila]